MPFGVASAALLSVSHKRRTHFQILMAPFIFIMALSILTHNCDGIRDLSKKNGLIQWLRSLPASVDVVCLQEAHCVSASECSLWFHSSGFGSMVSPGSVYFGGCIILFRPSLMLLNSWSDDDGRFLQCELFCVC